MRRVSFEISAEAVDTLCDLVLADLPHGLREFPAGPDRRGVVMIGPEGALPSRDALAAGGIELTDWTEEPTSADAAERRAQATGGIAVGERLFIRRPGDGVNVPEGMIDLVIERSAGGFGTGTHPTTRMCLELLLTLPPFGALADLGCGLGTLAIAAAKLGFDPIIAVDHSAGALEAAAANAERNAVQVEFAETDLTTQPVPEAATLLLNAPPAMHLAVAKSLPASTHTLVVSGLPLEEFGAVLDAYGNAGLTVAARREEHVWGAAVLVRES